MMLNNVITQALKTFAVIPSIFVMGRVKNIPVMNDEFSAVIQIFWLGKILILILHQIPPLVLHCNACYNLDMNNVISIINEINNSIKNIYTGFSGIYLYGSYANNTNNVNSDIDLVALFDNTLSLDDRLNLWKLITKIEAEHDVVLDLHPMSKKELELNPVFYNQVVGKGVFYGI